MNTSQNNPSGRNPKRETRAPESAKTTEHEAPPIAGLAPRRAALDILERVRDGEALDHALAACRSFADLEGPDRGFARAMASAVLRRRGGLDHLIGAYIDRPLPKKAARVMDILRLAAAQSMILKTPDHAVVSLAVTLASEKRETAGYAKLVNAVARKVAKSGAAALEKLPARIDTPAWMWRAWERAYGPHKARAIALAHQREAPVDITLKDDNLTDEFASMLEAQVLGPGALRLQKSTEIAALPGFDEGDWWVQDAAASLPVLLLGDVKDKVVYDLCAAPGGKTMQLASLGAQVTAVDKSEGRLNRVRENLERTKLMADVVCEDILAWRPDEKADAILLDAPCSATGTIRRHPDISWIKTETDIAALKALQAKMIDHALTLLKPGGMLIYCVCALQPEEGERQAEAALGRHDRLRRKPIEANEQARLVAGASRQGDLRTLPSMLADKGGMDGFFAVRFVLSE